MRSWLLIPVTAAAVCVALTAPPGRSAASDASITSLAPSAKQGGTEHLEALAVGGYTCTLAIRYADGRTQRLRTQRIVVFKVAWTWRVPATASPGLAHASLACGTAGSSRATFSVVRRVLPARLAVAKTGFTQMGADLSYGAVLVNRSPTSDANAVQVEVDLLDAAGRVVGSDPRRIAAIPAGGTYYLGGVVTTDPGTPVASVRPVVHVGSSTPASIRAPVVTGVRVTRHTDDDGAYVDGQVTNRAGAALSPLATISMVFFDGSGRIVGGGAAVSPSAPAAGGTATFELSTPVTASAIASVLVSVEPRYGP